MKLKCEKCKREIIPYEETVTLKGKNICMECYEKIAIKRIGQEEYECLKNLISEQFVES